jgi:hypothetical protein
MIAVDEVLFFVSDEKYTRVQTAQVEALIRKPIKELVDELDPQQFWQIHRSTLVNVKAIAGVTRDFRGRQIVSVRGHPEKLEVSRSYTGLFKGMSPIKPWPRRTRPAGASAAASATRHAAASPRLCAGSRPRPRCCRSWR